MPEAIEQPARRIPPPIWVIVVLLVLEAIGNLPMVGREPAALWWLVAKVIFITGLLRGWRLIFLWFVVVTAVHVVHFAGVNVIAAGLNAVMLLATLASWRHFFRTAPAPS